MAHPTVPFSDQSFAFFARDFDDPASLEGVILIDDAEPAEVPREPPPPAITAEMLAQACDAAREEGLRQGRAEGATAREVARDTMAASLLTSLSDADAKLSKAVDEAGSHLVGLVLAMIEVGFPSLRARHGPAEVVRFTREVVSLLGQEPRIVIRLHPSLVPDLNEVLASLEPERRAAVLVEPRDTLPIGDARIAWRHGMATRDTTALLARLAEILAPLGLTSEAAGSAAALSHTQ